MTLRTATDRAAAIFSTVAGFGPCHHILLPGLVPDGPETFLRQNLLLRASGTVTTITYPYEGFDLDRLLGEVEERVRRAAASGQQPVLMGVSVGGGLVLELLRRTQADPLPLAALILISPLSCLDDLAPMLRRYLTPILAAEGEADQQQAVDKARSFFRTLAARSAGVPQDSPWRTWLTPSGWAQLREQRIRTRIERTINGITLGGALERIHALPRLTGIHAVKGVLCQAPTLIAWGSRERHTLRMDGPGTGLLCRPDLACRLFPAAEVQWIYEHDGGEVPHASLLKHAHAFNPVIKRFLKRL